MKKALLVLALLGAGLGALAIRVVVEGRGALAEGDDAAEDGRLADAIASWERAARWYLPLAPHVDGAYARLRSLAETDHRHALAAWRAIRSASLATRGQWTPHEDDLTTANAQIAELASRDPAGAEAGGPDAATRRAFHAEQLARDLRPGALAVALALLGLAGWLVGIAVVLRRGFDGSGALQRRPAFVGAMLTVAGVVLWVAGLYSR